MEKKLYGEHILKIWVILLFESTNPADAFSMIRQIITDQLLEPVKIFCFGGDHSISYQVIDAFGEKYPNLNILHLDARADLYENFDNNLYSHASPFAHLLKKGKIKSLTQVGIRTLNQHQRDQAEKYGVQVIEKKNSILDFKKNYNLPCIFH